MNDSRLEEFVEIFRSRVRERRQGTEDAEGIMNLETNENAFTSVFLEDMEDIGLIPDSNIIYFEKRLGRANAKINGYSVSDDESHVVLCTTILGSESDILLKTAPASEITKAVNAVIHVYKAAKEPLFMEMEEAFPERDMMEPS